MKKGSFYQLFQEQLKDIYSAELQIVNALPKMIRAASLPELKDAFKAHLQDTRRQVQRLKKIFNHLGKAPSTKKCKGMEGLIKEGEESIQNFPASTVRDAALIAAAQRIEHYEIAGYGTARAYAKHMDLDDVVDFLQESLDEEGATNKKLTRLAEGGFFSRGINEEAQKEAGLSDEKAIKRGSVRRKGISTRKASTKRTASKTGVRKVGGKKTGRTISATANKKSTTSRKAKTTRAKQPSKLTSRTHRRRTSVTTSTPRVQIAARSGSRRGASRI